MKKLLYLLVSVFMISSLVSCEKKMTGSDDLIGKSKDVLKGAQTEVRIASTPVSDEGAIPYIIPGENRGGNRTCIDVTDEFGTEFAQCGEKIDYNEGEGEFDGEFPEGLNVEVFEDNTIHFWIDGDCFEMDGKHYKVGAVIVKGSNSANVYNYLFDYEGEDPKGTTFPDGISEDWGLAAPGGDHMVSNLTFCLVDCEVEEGLLAIKAWYYYIDNEGNRVNWWAATSGDFVFSPSTGWCSDFMGVNYFPFLDPINMLNGYDQEIIGTVSIVGGDVTIDLEDGLTLYEIHYLYGSLETLLDYLDVEGCPIYYESPWNSIDLEPNANSATFNLGF